MRFLAFRRRPAWFDVREPGRLEGWILAPLTLTAWCYGGAVSLLRALRTRRATRLPCRVVSVGNLCVGGSGKTPLVARVAELLHARGIPCAIASRGYARPRRGRDASGGVVVASNGRGLRAAQEAVGDEPAWLAERLRGVPVLVANDRARAGRHAVTHFGTRVLVLDDGFQHFKLARDLDLVAVDGTTGFGSGAALPRGPLREPLRALRFADAVVVVDGPLHPRDEAELDRWAPAAPRFAARRVPVTLRRLGSGVETPPDSHPELRGHVGIFCGVAQPQSVRRTLVDLGFEPSAERIFPNHHRYRPRDLRELPVPPHHWITTDKDAVKIDPSWESRAELWVLGIALHFEAEHEFAAWLEAALLRTAPHPG